MLYICVSQTTIFMTNKKQPPKNLTFSERRLRKILSEFVQESSQEIESFINRFVLVEAWIKKHPKLGFWVKVSSVLIVVKIVLFILHIIYLH